MNKACVLKVMRSVLQSCAQLSINAKYGQLQPKTLQWLNDLGLHCESALKLYETENNNFGIINVAEGFQGIKKDANAASQVKSTVGTATATKPEESNQSPSPSSQSPIAPKAVKTGKK